MKNLIPSFVFLAFGFCFMNFTIPQKHQQEILQSAIENHVFAEILERDQQGVILPFSLDTDYDISPETQLYFEGEVIKLNVNSDDSSPQWSEDMVYLKGMKVKDDRATLWFTYGDKKIKIKVVKKASTWTFRYGSAKSKGYFISHFDYD